jgi:uncharacterized membrane protein YfcA
VTFAGVGYIFGSAFGALLEDSVFGFMLSMLGLFLLVIGLKLWLKRRARLRRAGQAGAVPVPVPAALDEV